MSHSEERLRSIRVTVAANVHFRRFDDEMILLHLGRGDYFSLNEAGARIWTELSEGRSPEEIAHKLAADYDVAEDKLVEDCLTLIDELAQNDLISIRSS